MYEKIKYKTTVSDVDIATGEIIASTEGWNYVDKNVKYQVYDNGTARAKCVKEIVNRWRKPKYREQRLFG